MAQFKDGQQVEVRAGLMHWRPAKIVKLWNSAHGHFDRPDDYQVQFTDDPPNEVTRAVIDERNIREPEA